MRRALILILSSLLAVTMNVQHYLMHPEILGNRKLHLDFSISFLKKVFY